MECPKCGNRQSLSEAMGACPGCGGYDWIIGETGDGARLVCCRQCEKGRTEVDCKKCWQPISGKWLGMNQGELMPIYFFGMVFGGFIIMYLLFADK
jgi:hypothetical protein